MNKEVRGYLSKIFTECDRLKNEGIEMNISIAYHVNEIEVYNISNRCEGMGDLHWSDDDWQHDAEEILNKLKEM